MRLRDPLWPKKTISVSMNSEGLLEVCELMTATFSGTKKTLHMKIVFGHYKNISDFLDTWSCDKRLVLIEKAER